MDQKNIETLFSKDELWYNENIHANLISKVLSELIGVKAEGLLQQDEYFVQAKINDFISRKLNNTSFSAQREWNHIDNTVLFSGTKEPMVLYEVKSFIKPKEKRISSKAIYNDILKLAINKKEYPHIEAYMIIAGNSTVPREALNNGKLRLPDKFYDRNNRSSITLKLSFFEEQKIEKKLLAKAHKLNIKKISISPSRWRNYSGMCAISWRINKIL